MFFVQICNSCTKINAGEEDLSGFRAKVSARLRELRPDLEIEIQPGPTPCFRVCPLGRITMAVGRKSEEGRLTMSKEATVESVVEDILSFFKPKE